MSTFDITRIGNTLFLEFSDHEKDMYGQLVQKVTERLKEVNDSGELSTGDVLLLKGVTSITSVVFAIAHALTNKFSAVAVFEPGLHGYMVAVTTNPEYELGSMISSELKKMVEFRNPQSGRLICYRSPE